MITHTILVTQEDISQGVKKQCKRCPIALAVRRSLDTALTEVFPSVCYIKRNRDSFCETALLPDTAQDFIARFDHDQPVEPFSFQLTFEVTFDED